MNALPHHPISLQPFSREFGEENKVTVTFEIQPQTAAKLQTVEWAKKDNVSPHVAKQYLYWLTHLFNQMQTQARTP
jgi:hypothetical protein